MKPLKLEPLEPVKLEPIRVKLEPMEVNLEIEPLSHWEIDSEWNIEPIEWVMPQWELD
jgi:hypothetical protein